MYAGAFGWSDPYMKLETAIVEKNTNYLVFSTVQYGSASSFWLRSPSIRLREPGGSSWPLCRNHHL